MRHCYRSSYPSVTEIELLTHEGVVGSVAILSPFLLLVVLVVRLLAMEPSAILVVRLLALEPSAENMYEQDLGRELGPAGIVAFGPPHLRSLDLGRELRSAGSVALGHSQS